MLKKRNLVILMFALGGMTLIALGAFYRYMNLPTNFGPDPVTMVIESGMNLTRLSKQLAGKQIIEHPKLWTLYARLSPKGSQIKTGEYLLAPESSPLELLNQFIAGDVIEYQITIIEGWNFRQMLQALDKAKRLDHQLQGVPVKEIMSRLNKPGMHPEGLFFPDSYRYVYGNSDLDILKRASARLESVLQAEWENRQEGLPYESAYEALIMASIIEKETGQADERDEIAGVFIRRLEKGMRLQTDPTVIYGLGDQFKGNLTRKHLKQPGPYNTYVNKGLPPTPIALVGREAIRAALNPSKGTSLYFVAKGDGSHFFSDTLDEHINAVRKYQLKRKNNYQSAPSTTK